jgi:uncharacterized cupredoxin-like copper-binding protein
MIRFAATTALLLALAGAAVAADDDYIRNAKEHVDRADWKNAETITVTMSEHDYAPRDIVFKAGKAYKLELKNAGDKDHYFTAPEFFRNVAWRKAMVNKQAEIKAPYFTAVEVLKKGGQLDLYFVPVTQGKYTVYCTIDDHREKGMEGSLAIE